MHKKKLKYNISWQTLFGNDKYIMNNEIIIRVKEMNRKNKNLQTKENSG